MKIEIFLSPRAQEEAQAWNFSKSQGPYKEGEFGVFPSLRDYMKAVLRIFPSRKAYIDMGVPNPLILAFTTLPPHLPLTIAFYLRRLVFCLTNMMAEVVEFPV